MINLVMFNIYWYLILSYVVTFWALVDILRKKETKFLLIIFDYVILVFGAVAWYASIFTFQLYDKGTLPPDMLKDLDSWTNVLLTVGYLGICLYFHNIKRKTTREKETKQCE
jgi:hypothetical protein